MFARIPSRLWRDSAVAGIVFQVVHFIEHGAQLGYWFLHPTAAPWLTPWAVTGRDLLSPGGNAGLGNELLHLVGNGLFLVGLIGLCVLVERGGGRLADIRSLKVAVAIQGFHVAEHLLLTASFAATGTALGFSTGFGVLSGVALSTFRVWFHFLINLAATVYAVKALAAVNERDLLVAVDQRAHA